MDFETYYAGLQKQVKAKNSQDDDFNKFYDGLRMDIGAIPDTRPTFSQQTQQFGGFPSMDASKSPLMKQVSQVPIPEPAPQKNLLQKALDVIGYPSKLIMKYATPDAPLIGRREDGSYGNLPGTNARESYNAANPVPSTGNATLDKIGDTFGQFTGPLVGTFGTGIGAIPSLTEKALSRAGVTFGKGLGDKIAKGTIEGAVTGAPLNAAATLASKDASLNDIAKSANDGILFGGALGAAAPVLGAGIMKGAQGAKNLITKAADTYGEAASRGPVSNFSLFSKIGQKTRTPDAPENVSDLIDVGGRPSGPDKGGAWERFYTSIVNEQAPLDRATKTIGGKNVPLEENPSKIAWLSRGWKGKADTKLQYGFMDDAGNKVGQSLEEALSPVKGRLNDLRELAVAKRSLEYQDVGLQSGVKPELAQQTIAKFSNDAELNQAYEGLKNYITNMNEDTLVQSGLWSKEKLQQLQKDQPNYIPMYRVQEKGIRDGIQQASGKGFGNVKDPTKRRTGSEKPIVDPIESIVKQTYKNQALAERNNVMRSLVELAEKNPDNSLVQRVQNSKAADEIQKNLDAFISNPTADMEKHLNEALDLFKPKVVDGKPNVFTVMRNGKAEQWQIHDDQLATLIAGLGNEPSNPLINMVGKATGVLKAGLVLAPDFVVKNLVRDQMSAFINSKYGFIPLWDTVSGLISAARKDSAFWKWMNSGGANGAWVSLERDYLQGQIRELTQSNIRRMGNPVELMRKLSEWSEQGTRIGEFKRGLKKGASLKEAALASRDVTLDFSRIGSKTKSANKAIAFFNVAIQSLDKTLRQFKERPVATPVKAMTSITIPSIALYLLNHNNPKYEELPQWEKDSNWHFFIGDEVIRVPKPFEMGTIFGTFFERMLRDVKDNDPKAFDDFSKQTLTGFAPSVVPTLLTPWIEVYANKKMMTGAPIVPMREQNLLAKDQYGPYTTELAKDAGGLLKKSPRVIENYVTGYTGTLGKYGLQAADNAYRLGKGIQATPKADGGLADTPVLRSFISKGLEGASQSVDEFYKEKDRLTREKNSAKKSDTAYADGKTYNMYNAIGNRISAVQKDVREVEADKNMTPQQKRDELNRLNLKIINLARQAKGNQPISR